MAVRTVTVSLDEQAWEAADHAAKLRGESLSTWLSTAARERARIEEGLRGVAEYEAEYGTPTDEEMELTRRELRALGVGWCPLPAAEEAQWKAAQQWLRAARSGPD